MGNFMSEIFCQLPLLINGETSLMVYILSGNKGTPAEM